jgi:SulP family sulfate permease
LLPQLHPATTVLAALGLALTLGTSRVPGCSRVPGPLVALLLVSLLQAIFQFDGVATIGSAFGGIPMGFPAPSLPVVSYERVVLLLPAAFTIMMLGAIESLLSAVVADGMAGTRHDSSQELIGQGIANMLAPLFGGIAATGALARTATNVRNGANSPLAGVVHALTLLLVLLCAAPLAARIPLCVLAAILFVVAWNMSDARHFLRLLRTAPRADAVIALITFVLTLLTDLIVAVNIGVILAMLQFMRRMAASVEVLQVSDAQLQGELASIGRDALRPGVVVYAIHGPMFFAAVETLQRALAQTRSDPRALVIRLARVPFMDSTGIDALAGAIQDLERRDVRVVLCEANERVLRKLQNAGLISKDASPRYADSLAAAADQLINSAGI